MTTRPIPCTVHRAVDAAPVLGGVVLIVDVFRASNTVIAALAAGAAEVLLVENLDTARRLKKEHPGRLLLGERGGVMPEGFDGDNSPAGVGRLPMAGRRVVLTTSAGTRAVGRVRRGARAAVASFANATAVVAWVRRLAPARVHLLAAGLGGREPALEDDLCAEHLAELLAGRRPGFTGTSLPRLLTSHGAGRLCRLGQEADLAWCTRLDLTDVVPEIVADEPPHVARRADAGP